MKRSYIVCFRVALYFSAAMLAACGGSQSQFGQLPIRGSSTDPSANVETTAVGLWVASPPKNRIFGQDKSGKKTLVSLNLGTNQCGGPGGIKVDHQERLWVSCTGQDGESELGIQVYDPGRTTPAKTFGGGTIGYEYNDVAFDGNGHVFGAIIGDCVFNCSSYGGVEWWSASSPKKGRVISSDALAVADYLDADAAGNLYVGASPKSQCCTENSVVEINDPTTSPTITTIISPGSDQLGGIYVSDSGTVLNVVDVTARTISQYQLPWVPSETPFNVLGPTVTRMGKGQPTSGGFDAGDTQLALGDADGWVDIGNVATNRWSAVSNENLKHGDGGAAYVPSDK